jgi:RNA polymerase sigma-70 factor (ECF subfamily)
VPDKGISANGADACFDALVLAHYDRLCNFAARFHGANDVVEDIVQDVFLAIWRNHAKFRYDDPLPYLYQAVRNRAVMHSRRQQVRDRWLEESASAEPVKSPDDAAASVMSSDLSGKLAVAIDALPERCRLIFTMSREQDLSYAQIARALDVSVKTVEAQMSRALKQLRERLADYLCVAVTATLAGAAAVGSRWIA